MTNGSGDARTGTLADGRTVVSGPSVPWTWQIAEVFKIERGKIGPVESVLHPVPYGMGSGWSTREEAMSSLPFTLKLNAARENAVRDLGPDFNQIVKTPDGVPYSKVVTGVWLRQNSMRDFLVQSAVAGTAGSVILMLAALGIYGVVGLMVATRTREIAVRVALGASRRRVLVMIVFDVVKLVIPGVAVGLILTAALVRLNGENMGIPLSNLEPLAYVAGAAIAILVAVLASLAPARRAASVQPMVAMRSV